MASVDIQFIMDHKREAGYTWGFMAQKVGIHPTALSQKLHGHVRWSLDDVASLSDFLGCSMDRLVIK